MTTKRIIQSIVDYLQELLPDVTVTAATNYEKIPLPIIAVSITAEPHSIAMQGVLRCDVEITLREHSGDDEAGIQDEIETFLNEPDLMTRLLNDEIRVDHWQYGGAEEDWDESVRETKYSANMLATRI